MISDAAKEVKVESHVLRYWEEELHLPIKRNELGHRYYTKEDVERFRQIKNMKEKGLQLKAIKMILKDGKLNVLQENGDAEGLESFAQGTKEPTEKTAQRITKEQSDIEVHQQSAMGIDIVGTRELSVKPVNELSEETREEKAKRLQWLLRQLIKDTLQENNQELCREIKESVVKELDYQFRTQEEREEERELARMQRSEEYYKKMDELLRKKSRGSALGLRKAEKKKVDKKAKEEKSDMTAGNIMNIQAAGKKAKKKRHSIF